MTPYHVIEVSQKDVLRYFLVGPASSSSQEALLMPDEIPERIADGACLLLWKRDLPIVPYALAAEPDVLKRVLPKLMALPSLAAPVTSLFRAWTIDDIHALSRRRPPEPGHARLEAFVGLMIGELITRIGPQLDLKALSSSSARRTLAYVLASLQIAGAGVQETAVAVNNWTRAAELTQTQISSELIQTLARLSSFAQALPSTPRLSHYQIAASMRDWESEQRDGDLYFGRLLEQVISAVGSLKDVSREQRFDVLMALIQTVQRSGIQRTGSLQMMVGYLLSLIEPGSLDFLPLSYEMEDVMSAPGIACAYAMCAGLISGKEFLMRGAGLGVHIALSGLLQPRAPDISYQELQILGRSTAVSELPLRTSVPSLLEVELIPEISAAFFIGQRKNEQGGQEAQPRGIELDAHQVADLERITIGLEELGHLAERLRASVLHEEPPKGKRLYKKK